MDVGTAGALLATLRDTLARGMKLEAVLPAFTSNPAKLLRLSRKGTLAVGNDADLVVLDEQHRIQSVVVRGEIHVQDGTALQRGTFE